MANEFEGLFKTPSQARDEYLSQYMITPAQQSQQGLLQQVISTMSNAGAGIGYGIGKLAGGSSQQEIEANAVQDAMKRVKQMQLPSPADEFTALSSLLQQNPATQKQASIARQKAFELTKQQEEQQLIQRAANYRKEIANMPANLSEEEMLAYTENASRKYGNPEQALDAVKAGYARAAENKRVVAATGVLQRAFSIKDKEGNVISTMDPAVAALVAKDKELTNQLLNDRLQVKDIQTKVITDATSVKLVNAVTGETIKEYGKPAGGAKTSVEVDLGDVFGKAAAAAEGKAWGEAWEKMGLDYAQGASLMPLVKDVASAVNSGQVFAGGLSTQKLALAKFAGALGLPVDEETIKNTELLRTTTARAVQKIARAFPGSQSDKELAQLLASQANFEQNLPTIMRLLSDLTTEMEAQQITYRDLDKLGEKRRTANKNIMYAETLTDLQELKRLNTKGRARTATAEDQKRAKELTLKLSGR